MRTTIFQWHCIKTKDTPKAVVASILFFLALSLALIVLPASVGAKDYPEKPISLIVPWATGGSSDVSARILAPALSKILGVPVTVINKPGGSGIIGTLEAVKSAPDGYTILSDCGGTSSIQAAWVETLPYRIEERTYIARAMYTDEGLVVPASSPWKTVDDLVNAIKTNPAAIRWSLIGGTGVPDVCTAQFRAALEAKGIDLSKTRMIAYKGSGEVVVALAGGHVDIGFCTPSVAESLLGAGKLRVLAVAGDQRYKVWPKVPSAAEIGFPSVNLVWWTGLAGPNGMPTNVIKTLSNAVRDAVKEPDVVSKLEKVGFVSAYQPEDVFRKFVLDEAKAIKALKLK